MVFPTITNIQGDETMSKKKSKKKEKHQAETHG